MSLSNLLAAITVMIALMTTATTTVFAATSGRTITMTNVGDGLSWTISPTGVKVDRHSTTEFHDLVGGSTYLLSLAPVAWFPASVTIPSGTFTQGDQRGFGFTDEIPLREVTITQDFDLAATEVTNAQYAAMLNWALDPNGDGDGADAFIELDDPANPTTVRNVSIDPRDGTTVWQQQRILYPYSQVGQIVWDGTAFGIRDVVGHPDGDTDSRANHPVIEVTWYGSQFFCWAQNVIGDEPTNPIDLTDWSVDPNVAGWRLPTEAEWEYAARGGYDDGAKYPWWTADPVTHTEPDGSQCNSLNDGDAYGDPDGNDFDNWVLWPLTTPVGYYAANGYGLYDMSGNVWELCSDWYDSDAYDGLVDDGVGEAVDDPAGPDGGSRRVSRGGSWRYSAFFLRSAVRSSVRPDSASNYVGFRPSRGQGVPAAGG